MLKWYKQKDWHIKTTKHKCGHTKTSAYKNRKCRNRSKAFNFLPPQSPWAPGRDRETGSQRTVVGGKEEDYRSKQHDHMTLLMTLLIKSFSLSLSLSSSSQCLESPPHFQFILWAPLHLFLSTCDCFPHSLCVFQSFNWPHKKTPS